MKLPFKKPVLGLERNPALRAQARGFTLIELLGVIAIIAILAAMWLLALSRGKLAQNRKSDVVVA